MAKCKVLTVASQKGGTGKSTTVVNLAHALAAVGKKVLTVDFDPQANLSMCMGVTNPSKLPITVHSVMSKLMSDESLPDKSLYVYSNGKVDYIPSNIELSVTEINLRDEIVGEKTLSLLLDSIKEEYDYCIIDTNPYLGMLTINALAACDSVIIPVSPQLWSATGLTDLLKTIFMVKRKINPQIEIEGILLTMCDDRTNLCRDVKALIDEHYRDQVRIFNAEIPHTVKIGEANYASKSILDFEPKSKAAAAYIALAKEVLNDA